MAPKKQPVKKVNPVVVDDDDEAVDRSVNNGAYEGERLNDFQHILLRPDTYIGSIVPVTDNRWHYATGDASDGDKGSCICKDQMIFNNGLYNIIREIGSNVIDNCWRSKEQHEKDIAEGVAASLVCPLMKKVEITVDRETGEITFWNDGKTIPVYKKKWPKTDPRTQEVTYDELYHAEVYFGEVKAGTNFNDEEKRLTSGRNGMGSKATLTFSSEFRVEHTSVADKKKFVQVYRNNGRFRTEPEIETYRLKKGYTQISFIPDYERFRFPGTPGEDGKPYYGLTDDFISIIRLFAYEIAMNTAATVKFTVVGCEPEKIKAFNFEKYSKYIFPDQTVKSVYFQAPNGDDCVIIERNRTLDDVLYSDEAEMQQLSYVNGIRTDDGGVHVNAWKSAIVPNLVKEINAKSKDMKIGGKDVNSFLMILVRCSITNPSFDTQTKNYMNGPDDYSLYDSKNKLQTEDWKKQLSENIAKMLKWNFVNTLKDKLNTRKENALDNKEKNANLGRKVSMGEKLDEANHAGKKGLAHDCTLFITEGLSAKTMAVTGFKSMPGGRDKNGVFAVQGKFINVSEMSITDIRMNEEAKALMKILGLRYGVKYTLEEIINTLRYGHVCILTDQDDDGIHIRGLLLNFFKLFPGLYEAGYVTILSTSVGKVEIGRGDNKEIMLFYSNPELEEWQGNNPGKAVRIKYHKGLGSIHPKDVPEYFKNQKLIVVVKDDKAEMFLNLGFNKAKEFVDLRKIWIAGDLVPMLPEIANNFIKEDIKQSKYVPEILEYLKNRDREVMRTYQYEGNLNLSDFIDKQLIIFEKTALERALPCIWDGFKKGHRQAFYAIRYKNYADTNDLERVVGAVKDITGYHHGGASLYNTLTGMASGYPGSNNIPLLENDGNFGTRLLGGDDCSAPRYISTKLEKISHKIFRAEDDPLLDLTYVDGKPAEYKFFLPILCMLLVNGCQGIATGFKSDIYQYNPKDIVYRTKKWLECGCNDDLYKQVTDPMKPWYRGIEGDVDLLVSSENENKIVGWQSKGIIEKVTGEDNTYRITELPVGVWTTKFKEWIEYLTTCTTPKSHAKDKDNSKWKTLKTPVFNDFSDYSSSTKVRFDIKAKKNTNLLFNDNGEPAKYMEDLVKRYNYNNMYVIDEGLYPYKFEAPDDIMLIFNRRRLEYYHMRKAYQLKDKREEYIIRKNKKKFIKLVSIDKVIDLSLYNDLHMLEDDLENKYGLLRLKVGAEKEPSFAYLLGMKTISLTKNRIEKLKNEIQKIKDDLEILERTPPEKLWIQDLDEFLVEYEKFLVERDDEVDVEVLEKVGKGKKPAKKAGAKRAPAKKVEGAVATGAPKKRARKAPVKKE